MDIKRLQLRSVNPGVCAGSHKSWLNGGREKIDTLCPATGEVIATVETGASSDYEAVIEAAQLAFQQWRVVPAPKRGELVRHMADALRQNKSYLGDLVAYEMGKSKQEGDGEVQEMIDIADFAVGQSRMLYGLTMHSERPEHRMYEQWHPLGIIGVISAFNFPVAVWAWNAFIAAVCGNVVVWKPSSKTPLCAIAVQHICNQVMHDHGYQGIFNLFIPESHDVANLMVEDKRIPLISFTGSTKTGRAINQTVAARLGRCILELGGNNAIILDEQTNFDLAIPAIVFGAVGTAGQRCTSTRRVFVPKALMMDVSERLTKAYQQLKIGDPLDPSHHVGPLIDQSAVDQYLQAIEVLKSHNANILIGGQSIARKGYFVEPTIAQVENAWPIVQEETFAPILYLIPYNTLEEAIAMQNAVPQGLSSAIFTDCISSAERFLSAAGSDCGIANVNIGTSGAEIGGAFGGEKETGGGREAGSDAWKAYMRRQTNTINWGANLPLAQGIKFDLS
ncbi:MAG: aldehyde dehydrogenase family protein [Legionellales bacterium]|nr:aldehyde dehydrogenase family protein [Legionellales bacterium]